MDLTFLWLSQLSRVKVASTPSSGASAAERASTVVDSFVAAPAAVQEAVLAALARCAAFTADVELLQLLPELDASLQRTLERFKAAVCTLSNSFAPSTAPAEAAAARQSGSHSGVPPLPQDVVRTLLQLLPAADALQRAAAAMDAEVRTHGGRVLELAQSVHRGEKPSAIGVGQRAADLVAWRLSAAGEIDRALAWQDKAGAVLLPKTFASLAALAEQVDNLVLAALCAPCHDALRQARAFLTLPTRLLQVNADDPRRLELRQIAERDACKPEMHASQHFSSAVRAILGTRQSRVHPPRSDCRSEAWAAHGRRTPRLQRCPPLPPSPHTAPPPRASTSWPYRLCSRCW